MSRDNNRQIMISLPNYLLREVDQMTKRDGLNRGEFIHQAAKKHLHEWQQDSVREAMQQGYMEMANINLNIAAECFVMEEEANSKMNLRSMSHVQ